MTEIPTVGIAALAPFRPLAEALDCWRGFAALVPAAVSRAAVPRLVLDDSDHGNWIWDQVSEEPLAPIGCSFLRDLEVSGAGYLFHDGRFVREFVNISDVALRWLGEPDRYDSPLNRPRTNRIVIEEPALVVFGPGFNVYGHWLLDFMPRIFIAQQLLGAALDDFVFPLPSEAPAWVGRMIHTFCGIEPSRFRSYSNTEDMLVCRRACLPSYAHSGKRGDYALHPLMRTFYDQFGNPGESRPKRRICLSRRGQEHQTNGVWRIFENREIMEQMAVAHGFEIVRPEELSFPQQIDLFRSADCILGEHGSGMHAAVFADPGTIVATVGAWNRHQFQIAALFEQRSICLRRHQVIRGWETPPFRFAVTKDDLDRLFAMIDAVQRSSRFEVGESIPT